MVEAEQIAVFLAALDHAFETTVLVGGSLRCLHYYKVTVVVTRLGVAPGEHRAVVTIVTGYIDPDHG